MNKDFQFDISNIYAFQGCLKNEELLLKSSSGGITRALSNIVLSKNGTVFGVRYSNDFYRAEYCYVTKKEDIDEIIGSKYIYSDKKIKYREQIVSVYQAVISELQRGKYVLYFGLGCDVAAVKQKAINSGVDISKLFLVDLICQGPTFQEVQESYLKRLEKRYASKVCGFSVRYKLFGWLSPPYIRVDFENGKQYMESFYGSDFGFAFSHFSKLGCYQCAFRGEKHQSDMTIGDYWGIDKSDDAYNKNGVSIILVTTEKGISLLKEINEQEFSIYPADTKKALLHNPMYYTCREKYAKVDRFKENINNMGLHKAVIKEMGIMKYSYMKMRRYFSKLLRTIRSS